MALPFQLCYGDSSSKMQWVKTQIWSQCFGGFSPSWSWMVKHSLCLFSLSLVSNAFYSDLPETLKPAHTPIPSKHCFHCQKAYRGSSSQLYHWEHFSASASHICHFFMNVLSFRNLSQSLCDLSFSHSLEEKDTIRLPHYCIARGGHTQSPLLRSLVDSNSGFWSS